MAVANRSAFPSHIVKYFLLLASNGRVNGPIPYHRGSSMQSATDPYIFRGLTRSISSKRNINNKPIRTVIRGWS